MIVSELEPVADGRRAAVLLRHPLRPRILALAREPMSATAIAGLLGEPRQKVGYHVRQLRHAGFLRPAGQRKRRGLTEQRYVATARAYVLTPHVAGDAGPDVGAIADVSSAARIVALAARTQTELATVVEAAAARGKRVATLSLAADIRFTSPAQRAAFARALQESVRRLVAEHTSPTTAPDGTPAPGRAYRFVVSCHPVPVGGAAARPFLPTKPSSATPETT